MKVFGEKYTDDEAAFLREYAPGHSYKEIAMEFNIRFPDRTRESCQIRAFLHNHHISTGRNGRFEKGHNSPNKGKKGYCPKGCEKGWFKKGNVPVNHKPVGTESCRKDKNGRAYVYVKVSEPNRWRPKHILEWEKHNGPVPKGMVVTFLDNDTFNTSIDNLVMIDRATHARINQGYLRTKNPEINRCTFKIGELMTAIGKAKRRL